MRQLAMITMWWLAVLATGMGRTWTSKDGRTLEGDLVRVEGKVAVVKVNGRNLRIPFASLIEADVAFLKEEKAKAGVGTNQLFGIEMKAGTTHEVDEFLEEDLKELLAGKDFEPSKIVVKISLPEDFDPKKPQKVFWMVGALDNAADRRRGNIEMFRRGEPALEKGWVVIAADTNLGNPRGQMKKPSEADAEFHYFLVSELAKAWPDFRAWKHACGGHSTGAEGVFFRMAQLMQAEANVVGGFFSCCQEARLEEANRENRVRASDWREVKAYQSTGDQDRLVSENDVKGVTENLRRGGVRQIETKTFPGNHTMNDDQFREALDWFEKEKED